MECVQLKYKDVKDIREQILEEQEGICPICKKPVDKPVLDHHHKKKVGGTGLIRGVSVHHVMYSLPRLKTI
jgi:hypothetical protein